MTLENKVSPSLSKRQTSNRNVLIAKIALLLNYITKADYKNLLAQANLDISKAGDEIDILQLMLNNKIVSQSGCFSLKKAYAAFTKIQEDTRFGSLCLEFNFLTEGNLNLALEEQQALARSGQNIRLGDLLVEAGMIAESQKQLVLQKQQLILSSKTDPVDKPVDTSHMREIREAMFVYYIRNDGLTAFALKAKECIATTVSLDTLKESLSRNGIIYGLVDEARLNTFLESDQYAARLFTLANGLPPVDGVDAVIEYKFEKDYLKPGNLKADGTIDFRERGEIPFVKQGDLLAEKTPPRPGKDGVNVFGDTVSFVEARDIPLACGKGVRLSTDGLKAFSEVEGNPKIDSDGVISVNSAYFIEGDVDYNTGHIKFDKNIYITGTIKSGFRVEGIDVVANALDGGFINARGDILIKNGITDAEIISKGSISATYLHRSKTSCMRDLKIIKEIVDTKARMDGQCQLKNGRLVSSSIVARGGAVIKDIGSDRSKTSDIAVGSSTYIVQELKRIDSLIEKYQNTLEMLTHGKTKIETELAQILEKITNLMDSRKRTQVMVNELKHQNKLDNITLFQNSLIEATEKIENLSIKKSILKKQQIKAANDVARTSELVKKYVQEKFQLKRLEQNIPSRPVLTVGGTIFAGTRVHGEYARIIINKTQKRVRIMEIASTEEATAKKSWNMVVTPL